LSAFGGLILMLGVFTFGSSGFKSSSKTLSMETETSCFDLARAAVIAEQGSINLDNIQTVNFLTFVCEFYSLDDSIIHP